MEALIFEEIIGVKDNDNKEKIMKSSTMILDSYPFSWLCVFVYCFANHFGDLHEWRHTELYFTIY